MASSKVREALAQVQEAQDQAAAYDTLLSNLPTLSTPETISADLIHIINTVFSSSPANSNSTSNSSSSSSSSSSLGIVGQRTVVARFTSAVRATDAPEVWIAVGEHALELLAGGGQQTTFVDEAVGLRELAADGREATEDYLGAARALAEIPLDASQRRVTDADRARVWVRIVRCYLEVDDTTAAETYLNKLKGVMHSVAMPDATDADAPPDHAVLHLHFRLSQARIRDAKREFLAASQAYHDISLSAAIAEEERLHTLGMAVKCAILAPAGPRRSRALGRLFRDERAPGLAEFGMLEKMFFDRLLSPAEVARFARGLAPHQLATTADGSTVLAKAVVEHNLLGASRLYSNIGFAALGALLGLEAGRAEDTTARMIEQGRLVGRIDQIEEVIYFEGGEASGEKGSGRAEVTVGKEMRRWDANVQGLAEEVENVTNALQREFPDFVAANLVV